MTRLTRLLGACAAWAACVALLAAGVACSSPSAGSAAGPKPSAHGSACPSAGTEATGPSLLPDVTLPCLGSDQTVSLRRLTGKPLVLNLWATWCPECRKEMPAMQRFAAAAGSSVRIVGVDTVDRSRSAALSYLSQEKVRYPSVYDSDRKTLTALGVPGMPVTVFVTATGSIAKVHPAPLTFGQLRQAAAQYLHVHVAG